MLTFERLVKSRVNVWLHSSLELGCSQNVKVNGYVKRRIGYISCDIWIQMSMGSSLSA
jgi:hypothetical protein